MMQPKGNNNCENPKCLGVINSMGLQALKPKLIFSYLMTCTLFDTSSDAAAGICQLAVSQAIKGDVDGLLRGVGDKNTNEAVKQIVELVCFTSFKTNYF